jgi:hypothetical protein
LVGGIGTVKLYANPLGRRMAWRGVLACLLLHGARWSAVWGGGVSRAR